MSSEEQKKQGPSFDADDRISAKVAADYLGVTREAVLNLAKRGMLSSKVHNTARYFSKKEIIERKEQCREYVSIAWDTEALLAQAKKLNREAAINEAAAAARLKASKHWYASFSTMSKVVGEIVQILKDEFFIDEKSLDILHQVITIHPIDEIAAQYNVGVPRVLQIIDKTIRGLYRTRNVTTWYVQCKDEIRQLDIEVSGLKEQLRHFEKDEKVQETTTTNVMLEKLKTQISTCGFSYRTATRLWRANVQTVGELCFLKKEDIAKLHGIGRHSMNELDIFMQRNGLEFGMDVSEYGIVPNGYLKKLFGYQ